METAVTETSFQMIRPGVRTDRTKPRYLSDIGLRRSSRRCCGETDTHERATGLRDGAVGGGVVWAENGWSIKLHFDARPCDRPVGTAQPPAERRRIVRSQHAAESFLWAGAVNSSSSSNNSGSGVITRCIGAPDALAKSETEYGNVKNITAGDTDLSAVFRNSSFRSWQRAIPSQGLSERNSTKNRKFSF